MYCRNQQYQPWATPRTETVLDAEMPLLQEAQAADPIAAILDRLMTVVSKLETCLDDTDRFVGEFRPPVQPQPDPDPPTLQPEMPERRWQPYQPLTHASVTSQWYPPFGQLTLTSPGSYTQPHNFRDAYHAPQREVQQPHNYQTGPDPYAQPAYQARQPTCWDPPWLRDQSPLPFVDGPVPQQNPNAGYPGLHHQPHNVRAEQPRQPSCWDPPSYRCPQTFHTGYQQWQPIHHPPGVLHMQPTYQPSQFDRSLSPGTALLPAVAQPRSGSTFLPQQSREFIDSGQPRGLNNITNLMVRSPSPAQLASVNDYNEKLRVYRLDQAALLARVTARFEENIDDENIAAENIDNTPTMVLSEDIPEDIKDVSNNATRNDNGVTLDVLDDESCKVILRNDNMRPQLLVESYDDKNGDGIIVPTHHELRIKYDIEALLEENVVGCADNFILVKSLSNSRFIGATKLMFTCIIESWCRSSIQSLFLYRPFDPGGEVSPKLMFATLLVMSWFPP